MANGRKIYTENDFKVGDLVRHRTWTVPAQGEQRPTVWKRVLRIVDIYTAQDDRAATMFVCGGGVEFLASELVPVKPRR